MRTFLLILVLLSTLFLLGCEDCETDSFNFTLIQIDETWLPSDDADMLSLSVSGAGVTESTWNIYREDMPTEIRVTLHDSGDWLMLLEAWNSEFDILLAEAEQSFSSPSTVMFLNLEWQTAPNLIAFYTFEDTWLSGWGGTAYVSLSNGALQIQSTGQTAWVYHIFDHAAQGEYSSVITEFDLLFSDNPSFMDFRAHADNGNIDWASVVLFQDGNITFVQLGDNINAQTTYDTNIWYRFRITADNDLGDIGRYRVEIKERDSGTYFDLGEYDYRAFEGRPIDIVQISFGVQESETGHGTLTIDNVIIMEP